MCFLWLFLFFRGKSVTFWKMCNSCCGLVALNVRSFSTFQGNVKSTPVTERLKIGTFPTLNGYHPLKMLFVDNKNFHLMLQDFWYVTMSCKSTVAIQLLITKIRFSLLQILCLLEIQLLICRTACSFANWLILKRHFVARANTTVQCVCNLTT